MSYVAKEMKRLMGKAIYSRQMIEKGDHILVAVSGGKDSLALLWLLRERMKRIPINYQITAAHIDPGFGTRSANEMRRFFEKHDFAYRVVESDFGPRAHSEENKENPCFLCSHLRRMALFDMADQLACNKIAFGHHKDDLIETFFINVLYGASLSTMVPVQPFFNGKIKGIRPFFMIEEKIISKYARSMEWPVIDLGCPTAGSSKRKMVKDMLNQFYRSNRKIKGNIFHALQNVRMDYLP